MSDSREFHSVAEAREWGQKWFSGWSKQQKETGSLTYQFIQHYTGGSHHMYHKAAKSGCQFEGESSFVHREFCAAARELQSISSPENIVVYRKAQKLAIRELAHGCVRRGIVLEDESFVSTSLLRSCCRSDHSQVYNMEILVRQGTPGAFIGLLSPLDEFEYLLAPHVKMRVTSRVFNTIKCETIFDKE